MEKTIELEDFVVKYQDTPEIHKAVFERVISFFTEHEAFCGDSIQQCDNPTIDAPCVLSDIADDIIKFKVTYIDN